MNDKYRVLRTQLKEKDIDVAYLADKLGVCTDYVRRRLRGAAPWIQTDMYAVLDMLHIPYDQIHIIFPPGGMYAGDLATRDAKTPEELLAEAIRLVVKNPA